MRQFDDRFSNAASAYSRYRPTYPAQLFDFLAGVAPTHALAWDCGTGSAQAAIQLAGHFEKVVATDPSAAQLSHAPSHDRIEYRCEPAENVSLPDGSVSLITVAAALHWFDLQAFYSEAARVLEPRGVVAVWAYHLPKVSPAVDEIVAHYSSVVLAADWPSGARYVLDRYASIPFPFDEIAAPGLDIDLDWTVDELAGFIGSWSAAIAYRERSGNDPVDRVIADLRREFGEGRRRVRCPLFLRVGRV